MICIFFSFFVFVLKFLHDMISKNLLFLVLLAVFLLAVLFVVLLLAVLLLAVLVDNYLAFLILADWILVVDYPVFLIFVYWIFGVDYHVFLILVVSYLLFLILLVVKEKVFSDWILIDFS